MLLGAGLDTFAQRRPDLASLLRVFEARPAVVTSTGVSMYGLRASTGEDFLIATT